MPDLTPAERKLRGRIAVETSWGNIENRSARTAKARRALEDKFLAEAGGDPQRAGHLRRAYFARLALKSAQARRKAKEARALTANTDAALTAAQRECYQELERRARGGA